MRKRMNRKESVYSTGSLGLQESKEKTSYRPHYSCGIMIGSNKDGKPCTPVSSESSREKNFSKFYGGSSEQCESASEKEHLFKAKIGEFAAKAGISYEFLVRSIKEKKVFSLIENEDEVAFTLIREYFEEYSLIPLEYDLVYLEEKRNHDKYCFKIKKALYFAGENLVEWSEGDLLPDFHPNFSWFSLDGDILERKVFNLDLVSNILNPFQRKSFAVMLASRKEY